MRFSQWIIIAAAATVAMVASTGAAMAYNYSGSWPVTVTNSQRSNGTYCLTLNGGINGGSASLVAGGQKYPYGSFLVINNLLVATITEPLYGQNGSLMFIVPARRGDIGRGIFENVEGGSNFDTGKLTFGLKNGC